MAARPVDRYTLEEYLEMDRQSAARLEYRNGEIFDMSGVSKAHAQIEINLIGYLRGRLAQKGCRLFPANMRINVPSAPPYRYADLCASCAEPEYIQVGGVDVLT